MTDAAVNYSTNWNLYETGLSFLPTLNDITSTVKSRTDAAYFMYDSLNFNFIIADEIIGIPI